MAKQREPWVPTFKVKAMTYHEFRIPRLTGVIATYYPNHNVLEVCASIKATQPEYRDLIKALRAEVAKITTKKPKIVYV